MISIIFGMYHKCFKEKNLVTFDCFWNTLLARGCKLVEILVRNSWYMFWSKACEIQHKIYIYELRDKKSFPIKKYLTFYKTFIFWHIFKYDFQNKAIFMYKYTARYFTSEFYNFLYPNSRVEKQRGNRQLTYNSNLFWEISVLMRKLVISNHLKSLFSI